jgi:hypothetical protein
MTKRNALINAVPYLALLFGILIFLYGTFGTFESSLNKEFFSGLGKTILASGIFALLLKTIQFMGVFKNELTKVVYDPKFLANRKDLPEIWEGISKEVFKNKFSGISKKLLKDITEVYFPTKHTTYYDDLQHLISIKFDAEGLLLLDYMVELNVVCSSAKEQCIYEYSSVLTFKNNRNEVTMDSRSVKVDKQVVLPEHKEILDGNQLINRYKLILLGKERYRIERDEYKRYSLDIDNIMYFRAAKITNNIKVTIEHPPNLIVNFKKCGTIYDYELARSTTSLKEYRYNGIVYPEQGYLITLNLQ